jgi:pimeloyl-ACP methyl ester carboxylesterase
MSVGIVLVHGAFHGPWVWEKVVHLLQVKDDQLEIAAPDLYAQAHPSHSTVIQAAVDGFAERGPVIVCGHSFGGLPMTALQPASVAHLVYLAAMLPDTTDWFPADHWLVPEISRAFRYEEDQLILTEEGAREFFYDDGEESDVLWAVSQLRSHPRGGDPATVGSPCWRQVPTTYVTCARDACVSASYMRAATERVGRGLSWPTGHSPMVSHPELVAELLRTISGALNTSSGSTWIARTQRKHPVPIPSWPNRNPNGTQR